MVYQEGLSFLNTPPSDIDCLTPLFLRSVRFISASVCVCVCKALLLQVLRVNRPALEFLAEPSNFSRFTQPHKKSKSEPTQKKKGNKSGLANCCNRIISRSSKQGFEDSAAGYRFDWKFSRKRHQLPTVAASHRFPFSLFGFFLLSSRRPVLQPAPKMLIGLVRDSVMHCFCHTCKAPILPAGS